MLCAWETYLLKTKGLAITHSPSERSYRYRIRIAFLLLKINISLFVQNFKILPNAIFSR